MEDQLANLILENQRVNAQLTFQQHLINEQLIAITSLRDQLSYSQSSHAQATKSLQKEREDFGKFKKNFNLLSSRLSEFKEQVDLLKAENNSLMNRKISSDMERILNELSRDQVEVFARDINGRSHEELASKMATLALVARTERESSDQLKLLLKSRTLEIEDLKRKVRKRDEQLKALQFLPAEEEENAVQPPPKSTPLFPAIINVAKDFSASKTSIPKIPPKFASAIKRSFETPDGTGGTKRQSFR